MSSDEFAGNASQDLLAMKQIIFLTTVLAVLILVTQCARTEGFIACVESCQVLVAVHARSDLGMMLAYLSASLHATHTATVLHKLSNTFNIVAVDTRPKDIQIGGCGCAAQRKPTWLCDKDGERCSDTVSKQRQKLPQLFA
jgi:hypothetical protein